MNEMYGIDTTLSGLREFLEYAPRVARYAVNPGLNDGTPAGFRPAVLTRSRPLARPDGLRSDGAEHIPFAASQAAQVTAATAIRTCVWYLRWDGNGYWVRKALLLAAAGGKH